MKFCIEQKLPMPKGKIQCEITRNGVTRRPPPIFNTFTTYGINAYIGASSHSASNIFRNIGISFDTTEITNAGTEFGSAVGGISAATGAVTSETIEGSPYYVIRRTRIYEPGAVDGIVRQFGTFQTASSDSLCCGRTVAPEDGVEVTIEDQLTVHYFILIPVLSNPQTLYTGTITLGGDAGGTDVDVTYERQQFVDADRPYFPDPSRARVKVNGTVLNSANYNSTVVKTTNDLENGEVEWTQDIRIRASAGNLNINNIEFFDGYVTGSVYFIGKLSFATALVKSNMRKLDIQVRYKLTWDW